MTHEVPQIISPILDAHGQAFSLGASAYVQVWTPAMPLRIPYLWTVIMQDEEWYVQPRPEGDLQLLTASFGRKLCIFQEASFIKPEINPDDWQKLLKLGWVIHAEQVGNKPEYLFQARCAKPTVNKPNEAIRLVIAATSLRRQGTTPIQQAGLLWRHLLKEISKRAKSSTKIKKH